MRAVTVTFVLADWIAKGLADGTFERVGGVIRDVATKKVEVQAISQLGISFHEWLKLSPSKEVQPDGANLMYIIPEKPLDIQISN